MFLLSRFIKNKYRKDGLKFRLCCIYKLGIKLVNIYFGIYILFKILLFIIKNEYVFVFNKLRGSNV